MRYPALFLFILFSFFATAQEESTEPIIILEDEEPLSQFDIKNWRDNLSFGVISTYYIDFATSPVTFSEVYVGMKPDPNDPNNTIPNYDYVPYQTQSVSYFSFGLEPRYNLFEYGDNLSAGISIPMTIGIGQTRAANAAVNGVTGLGNIQIPFLAKVFLGSAASKRSEETFGVNVGAGYELNKIALIALDASQEEIASNKAWFMPTVAVGVNFYRGRSPMEVNLKYGFGKIQEITTNGTGGTIPGNSRDLRASSIKLSLIYLIY